MTARPPKDPTIVHVARRLFSLPAHEFGELLIAQAALLRAWWTVWTRPKGGLLRPIDHPTAHLGSDGEAALARLVIAVDRAARYGLFRPTCLVRAVALERMITRARVGPAVVKVGVLRQREEFLAHAWIELDGRVVGDEPARVSHFTPLHDFSALAR